MNYSESEYIKADKNLYRPHILPKEFIEISNKYLTFSGLAGHFFSQWKKEPKKPTAYSVAVKKIKNYSSMPSVAFLNDLPCKIKRN